MLFNLLKRLLKDFHPVFPIIAILLFIAHPVYTEVVASLKNRDEMLSFLGVSCLFVLYIEICRNIEMDIYCRGILHLSTGLGFLKSKRYSVSAIFPLVLYFFTNSSPKKLLLVFAVIFVALILARYVPTLYLPKPDREVFYFENPLCFHPGLIMCLGTGMIALLFYLKILIFPHPLLFYYGTILFR